MEDPLIRDMAKALFGKFQPDPKAAPINYTNKGDSQLDHLTWALKGRDDVPSSIPYTTPPAAANSSLSEGLFKQWVAANNVPLTDDYDMKGFFNGLLRNHPLAEQRVNETDHQLHYSDLWKKPNHESFSKLSGNYDPKTMKNIPMWEGGPIETPQSIKQSAEAWTLRKPNGQVVIAEVPWREER